MASMLPTGNGGLVWNSDGRLLFNLSKERAIDVWSMTVDQNTGKKSSDPTRVYFLKDSELVPMGGSDDGKRLLLRQDRPEERVFVGDLTANHQLSSPRSMTNDHWNYTMWSWTADSSALLLSTNRNGTPQNLQYDIGDDQRKILMSGANGGLQATPDGRHLLVTTRANPADKKSDAVQIRAVDADGSAARTLVSGNYADLRYRCSIGAGGQCVLCEKSGAHHVFSYLDAEHGLGKEIARTDRAVSDFDISPDGSRIALVSYDDGLEIGILSVATGKTEVLHAKDKRWSPQGIAWGADGQRLYVTGVSDPEGFALLSIAMNGETSILAHEPFNAGWINRPRPSPSGRKLAYNVRKHQVNLLLLENF